MSNISDFLALQKMLKSLLKANPDRAPQINELIDTLRLKCKIKDELNKLLDNIEELK